ncbi:MAG: glycosyltransferase [Planctomycetes bacterium]|nr:glycosyltransferase [Planctomycetota bacterium]
MQVECLIWITAFHVLDITIFEGLAHYSLSSLPQLRDQPIPDDALWPSVTIVIAARNEERDIEPAIRSMLKLDYPSLRFTAVNDRSTDSTGDILDRLAHGDRRLHVVHVKELPSSWLGKNHALQLGSDESQTDYLLFTDADVSFDPLCLRRAVAYSEQYRVDHLTMFPSVPMPNPWLDAFVIFFFRVFMVIYRAWQVANPRRTASLGLGAFNLIRKEVYEQVQGHHQISMEVVDDLMIGQIIKRDGFRQHVLQARDDISVPWYQSISELVVGLDKNVYAGVGYNLGLMTLTVISLVLTFLWPFIGIFVLTGIPQMLLGIVCALLLGSSATMALRIRVNPISTLFLPWIITVFVFTIIRATILFYIRGGIKWRDTLYTRKELMTNRIK